MSSSKEQEQDALPCPQGNALCVLVYVVQSNPDEMVLLIGSAAN